MGIGDPLVFHLPRHDQNQTYVWCCTVRRRLPGPEWSAWGSQRFLWVARRADLAIGVPSTSVGTFDYAGAVTVLFGGSKGMGAAVSKIWAARHR